MPFGGSVGPGTVNGDGGGEEVGGHAVLVVGHIANGAIAELVRLSDDNGGGWLIAKNSWGCKGDGGYVYLAYDWVINQAHSAWVIPSVASNAAAPSAALTIDPSTLTAPGSVTLTARVNRHTTWVQFYRGLGTDDIIDTRVLDGGEEATVTATNGFVSGAQNGVWTYWARASDQFGNAVSSGLVGVRVAIDDQRPEVTLAADATTVVAPGAVVLRATAEDNVGVTRVKFYRGLSLIGDDASAPFARAACSCARTAGRSPATASGRSATASVPAASSSARARTTS